VYLTRSVRIWILSGCDVTDDEMCVCVWGGGGGWQMKGPCWKIKFGNVGEDDFIKCIWAVSWPAQITIRYQIVHIVYILRHL
jgi:hypothetical protein